MRTALLAVAALAAAGLVVPVTMAAAADPQPAGTEYRDPAHASAATVSVTGTLTPIHSETGAEHSYAVALANGSLVPVSIKRDVDEPRPFRGDLAITDELADDVADRGVSVDPGDDLSGTSAAGRTVLAAAGASTQALPVQDATIGSEPTASAVSVSTHRLYAAVITNRGTLDTDIATKLARMRSYWTTEGDGRIGSFEQPSATVSYASTAAPSAADGCGLQDPTATWNEAATKFPGVNFSSAGNHLMVLVPSACGANGAAGIGTVGSSLSSGGRTIVTLGNTAVAIGVHELGHNLSLSHANAERCSPSCSTSEYWDLYSIMGLAVSGGSWTPASLDTSYRLLLGIDDSSTIPTVTATSTVHLTGRATSAGTRGLVVTDPSTSTKYTVEYRSGTGRDAQAFYAPSRSIGGYSFSPGIVIERMNRDGSTAMITRQSGSTYLTSFGAGTSFTRGSLTISVTSASPSAGADVTVTLPGATAPTSTPPSSTAPTSTPPSSTPPTSTPPTSTPPTTTPPTTPPPTSTPPSSFSPGTPVVVGTPRVGQRLSVATTRWSPAPTRYTVRWLADGRALAGAVYTSYVPTRAQYGARISVVVTGSRNGYVTTSRTSAETRPVVAGRFSSRDVRIVGRAKVGRTLKVVAHGWQPSPAFSYRWYANGHPIAKATGRTLKVTRSLRGKRITVRVTARQYAYVPASRTVRTARIR